MLSSGQVHQMSICPSQIPSCSSYLHESSPLREGLYFPELKTNGNMQQLLESVIHSSPLSLLLLLSPPLPFLSFSFTSFWEGLETVSCPYLVVLASFRGTLRHRTFPSTDSVLALILHFCLAVLQARCACVHTLADMVLCVHRARVRVFKVTEIVHQYSVLWFRKLHRGPTLWQILW